MKFKKFFLSMAALLIFGAAFFVVNQQQDVEARYDRRKMTNMEHTEGIKKAIEYLSSMKGERLSGHIDRKDVIEARYQLKKNKNGSKAVNLQWNEEGPDNVGGRTRTLCFDKNNPNTMYMGGVSGGLWKSTTGGSSWNQVKSVDENLIISSVEQAPNGDIYVGTGENFANVIGNSYSSPGFLGTGIYKSTDGTNFSLLSSTVPSTSNSQTDWSFVNRIAINSSGTVYAATNKGLRYSTDGGSTWQYPGLLANGANYTANAQDVKYSGGTIAATVGNRIYVSDDGTPSGFTNVSKSGNLPGSDIGRIELAISDNGKVIYAVIANGQGALKGIYMSDDTGSTWNLIGPGSSSNFAIFGDNKQGNYDNVVAVDPDDPYHVFVGGINMWEGQQITPGQIYSWHKITQGSLDALSSSQSAQYVHVDHHVYKFHPNKSNYFYAGTDGGLFLSKDKGQSWAHLNRDYNVTQFYTLAIGPQGEVMGGTQDNSTPYVSGHGNTPMSADVLFFGDGGHAAFSILNQDIFFVTSYYGTSGRSIDKGQKWELGAEYDVNGNPKPGYYSQRMIGTGAHNSASFVTPIRLWEGINVDNSKDSIWFKADSAANYTVGDTLLCRSNINRYPFKHILSQNLNGGDSIKLADPVQSRFFLGTNGAVWMTHEALNFSVTPEWYKIANIDGTVQSMVISEDGDMMYVGTQGGSTNGKIYRIKNIMSAWDSTKADVTSSQQTIEVDKIKEFSQGRWVTSIALDPSDKDHIIVTLGNYGESTYIYESKDATGSNPSFTAKQGNLPAMPVYASLIPMWNSNTVLIGTEYGVYATDDISSSNPTWVEENKEMGNVPVFILRQQTNNLPYYSITEVIEGETFTSVYPGVSNYGKIYAATYGRGIFSADKYVGISKPGKSYSKEKDKMDINLYPNPVSNTANVEFDLRKSSDVALRIFDMKGKLMDVREEKLTSGKHKVSLDVSDLEKGNYILQMIYGDKKTTSKQFIVF